MAGSSGGITITEHAGQVSNIRHDLRKKFNNTIRHPKRTENQKPAEDC